MKRTTSHTPGPWSWDEMDGRIYVTPKFRPCHYVADINSTQTDPGGEYPRRPQREANARLITAAPELLAALETAESFMTGFEDDETQEGMPEMLATIRAAISKAKTGGPREEKFA